MILKLIKWLKTTGLIFVLFFATKFSRWIGKLYLTLSIWFVALFTTCTVLLMSTKSVCYWPSSSILPVLKWFLETPLRSFDYRVFLIEFSHQLFAFFSSWCTFLSLGNLSGWNFQIALYLYISFKSPPVSWIEYL